VPPLPAREHRAASEFHERHGRTLLAAMIEDEERDERRMLVASGNAVAFVPACARYPYESWIVPRRAVARLDELTAPERTDLASALRAVVRAYDALWDRPMPYLLAVHQGPTVADAPPGVHLHIELSPARRARDRLKFLAGTELAAGTFANDSLPEAKAAELQAAIGRSDG
jgi:UDPglucose--hexose-1-phosphate uridylyltransferase